MKNPPFVGVTGITDATQLIKIGATSHTTLFEPSHRLKVGFRVSRNSLANGEDSVDENLLNRGAISSLLESSPNTFNCIHHIDTDGFSVEDWFNCLKVCDKNVHAFQVNAVWPKPTYLRLLKDRHPDVSIILEIGREAFEAVGYRADMLAEKVLGYQGCIDYVILMPNDSGKKMKPIDLTRHLEALDSSKSRISWGLRVGVGGHIGNGMSDTIKQMIGRFGNYICFDAALPKQGTGNDHSEIMPAVSSYLQEVQTHLRTPPVAA